MINIPVKSPLQYDQYTNHHGPYEELIRNVYYTYLHIQYMKERTNTVGGDLLRQAILKAKNVSVPEYSIKDFPQFELSRIPTIFKIADFERYKSDNHASKIQSAIINNKFFDNIIRVCETQKKDWVVIDGQHRLAALYNCNRAYSLKTYPLIVIIYRNMDLGRLIYRRNNMGKALTFANHLKVFDTKHNEFFNDLRPLCCHDDHSKLVTFADLVKSLIFCKYNAAGTLRYLESIMEDISASDINFCKDFARAMEMNSPTKERGIHFRAVFMRGLFRTCWQNKANVYEISELISKGRKDELILTHIESMSRASYEEVYQRFQVIYNETFKMQKS